MKNLAGDTAASQGCLENAAASSINLDIFALASGIKLLLKTYIIT
jgi:hypothetical protein